MKGNHQGALSRSKYRNDKRSGLSFRMAACRFPASWAAEGLPIFCDFLTETCAPFGYTEEKENREEQKTMAKDKPTFSAFEDTNPIDVFNNVAKTNNDAKGVASVKVEKEKLTDKETAQLKMMCTPQYLELVQAFITIVKKEDTRIKDQKTLLQVALNDYMQNHKKALDKAKSIVED